MVRFWKNKRTKEKKIENKDELIKKYRKKEIKDNRNLYIKEILEKKKEYLEKKKEEIERKSNIINLKKK